jgi:hypothetical protein
MSRSYSELTRLRNTHRSLIVVAHLRRIRCATTIFAPTPAHSHEDHVTRLPRTCSLSARAIALALLVPMAAPPAQERPVRVCAGGDVTLGTNLDTAWTRRMTRGAGRRVSRKLAEPSTLLAPLRPLVEDADIVLLNLEGAIGEGAVSPKCGPRATDCYALRQPVSAARALRALTPAPMIVNVANNHSGDAGEEGLVTTLQHLADAEVLVTGADTLATIVRSRNGDSVAMLGFSTSSGPDPRDLDAVRRHVARASAITPRVVVTMHMGAEGKTAQRARDTTERYLGLDRGNVVAFARAAAEAGARLVVGHGPHVVRAAEWHGDALIFYSLGNLLTYGPFSVKEPMNRGGVACATLDARGTVREARLRPTVQLAPGLVRPDRSARGIALVDSLSRLDFPRSRAGMMVEAAVLRPAAPARSGGS